MNEEEIIQKLWDIAITSTFETKDYPNRVVMKDDLLVLLKSYEQEKEERGKADHNFDEITIKMAKLDTELLNEKEKNKKLEEQINDLSNRIVHGICHIEDTCIAKNEDGTKREIASIGDLEELKDILGGKYLYE